MIRLVVLLMFPALAFSQKVDTLRIRMYSSDTATKSYKTLIYVGKDTIGETIYRIWNKPTIEEKKVVKRKKRKKDD